MIVLELDEVEVDYCTTCKGVWLDPGELELLAEMAGAGAGPLSQAIEGGGRKIQGQKRLCPACRRKMLEIDVEGPPRVTVDRCRYGHGLWLDDRELGQLIESVGGSPETEALARLCGRLLRSDRQAPSEGGKDDVGTNPVQ
jgi:Zn-finger nucleic acid-binding protein